MSGPKPEAALESAQLEAERAKKRLASTLGALQYRLKPGTLMNKALDGVRERGGEMADDAMTAVKERPMTVSGIIAALLIFLARDPLWRLLTSFFAKKPPEGTVQADLAETDESYDLTAPTVEKSRHEGVNA